MGTHPPNLMQLLTYVFFADTFFVLGCRPQELMEPFHYINLVPGKDVRGKLIDAFQVTQSETILRSSF